MIRPCPRAIVVVAALTALCLLIEALTAPGEIGAAIGWAVLMSVVLANLLDLALALRLRVPPPARVLPERLIAGQAHSVTVKVENPHGFSLRLGFNERPAHLASGAMRLAGLPRSFKAPARHQTSFEYFLQPVYRGLLALGECELYVSGPLGLWQARRTFTLPQRAQAGPDFTTLERLARQCQRSTLEVAHRHFNCEQRNIPFTLVVWLDTGPGLQTGAGSGRLWDHATDATLALAFAAVGEGRPIGLHLNAGLGNRQLLPSASERQLSELQRLLGAVQPGSQQVDFTVEVARLLERPLGPTLIILMTRLPAQTDNIQRPLSELALRHRLLIVDVLDECLVEARRKPVRIEADAQGYCRAIQAASAHEQAAGPLTRAGLNVVHAPGNTLANVVAKEYARAWQ